MNLNMGTAVLMGFGRPVLCAGRLFCSTGLLPFFAFLSAVLLFAAPVKAQYSKSYSRAEISEDLTEAYQILQRYQPNFTRHNSASQQQALYEKLKDSIPETVSTHKAYLLLTELVGAVCDEHTQLIKRRADHSIMPPGWPWFEQPLFVRDGKLFIEDAYSKAKEEVVSINGVSGPDIASALAARMPNDGCVDDGVLVVNGFLKVGGHVVNALIGTGGPFWVTVLGQESGKQRGLTVEAIKSLRSKMAYVRFRQAQLRDVAIELLVKKFKKTSLGGEVGTADLTYLYSERRKTAYLKVGSFELPDKAKAGIEKVMRDIIIRRPDALILDFTEKPGGYTETAQFFMAFLLPRAHRLHSRAYRKDISRNLPDNFKFSDASAKDAHEHDIRVFRSIKKKNGVRSARVNRRSFGKPDYKGKIYVLISPESRSNAIKVAANLRRLRQAVIVGNVTAANTVSVCAAANGSFRLKNTGFILSAPELCFSSPENKFSEEGVLVPDIPVDIFDWPLVNLNTMILRTALENLDNSSGN